MSYIRTIARGVFLTTLVAAILLFVLPVAAGAQSGTECSVRFAATWSAATHPEEFPPNPHFSGLIGGSHNDQVSFWEPGGFASLGTQRMAEQGAKGDLQDEVESAITSGTALAVLSGGGIGTSPGEVTMSFDLEVSHPYVTLVSMIAPSPDWFVGVTALALRDATGWLSPTVSLVAWDAGTDSGESFTSGNQETMPQDIIHLITTGPLGGTPPLGTFEFRCALFVDGFESEDTGFWSGTVPAR